MRKRTPAEARRVVPKRTKIILLCAILLGALLLIGYKIPYTAHYTATLYRCEAGKVELYGDVIDVELDVRVQRYFFAQPSYAGTVTVGDDVYTNDIGDPVPTPSLLGALAATDSFELICAEWRGNYLVTRCVATVQRGQITNLYLKDKRGLAAGEYGRLSAHSP